MSDRHVVVGAGPVGRATARLLAEGGHPVVLVSRSGSGDPVAGAQRVAADAGDTARLVALTEGAAVLYNCVNPPSYDVWATWWPPIAEAMLCTAERTGAALVTVAPLYAYGRVEGRMVEGMPDAARGPKGRLRAAMWAEAQRRHDEGRLRAVEVRASDYLGPGVDPDAGHLARVAPGALAGRTVRVFGRPDVPHSFTDVRDVARAVVAVGARPSAWGRVWHAPTNPARTQAETLADICGSVGRTPGAVKAIPHAALVATGWVMPVMRELRETEYQFTEPFVLDSAAIERELGLAPTPWAEACRATAQDALAAA